VTFTNKAANEMKERLIKISKDLQEEKAKEAKKAEDAKETNEKDTFSAFAPSSTPSAQISFPRV
jgi:superfamily I DNA/RNA helicase